MTDMGLYEIPQEMVDFRETIRQIATEKIAPRAADIDRNAEYPHDIRKILGEQDILGLPFDEEYGGTGTGTLMLQIAVEEIAKACASSALILMIQELGTLPIQLFGSDELKQRFLPKCATGEWSPAFALSEPEAGSDPAAMRTTAVKDGDEWVINGQKIWNSLAHMATHEWLCVRTDQEAPKHRGISVIMVPIATPGIEVRPLITWDDFRTNETFFTDVRVPRTNLIGEVNRGWQYITGALDLERGALTNAGDLRRAVDEVIAAARLTLSDGSRPLDNPDVRRKIAQLDADVEVCMLMSQEAASLLESGQIPTSAVTEEKIISSELRQRIADVGTQMFGLQGLLTRDNEYAVPGGGFEKLYRSAPLLRFGGGANEVLRDVIAQRGHGMPTYGRGR